MLSNKEIKDIQSLSDKKRRDEAGLFIAEGPKVGAEMIGAAPEQVQAVYALSSWAGAQEDLLHGREVTIVDERTLGRISQLQTPNQVLVLMRQFATAAPVLQQEWALYLDAVQDPGNMGTIIRLADWFAIPHIVCTPGCADVYNPKVVQSTMASLARVNIWTDKDGSWLERQSVPVLAATLQGEDLYRFEAPAAGVLMIGNESKGLRPELVTRATTQLTIPRRGNAESLNAAVATGIILSHLLR